MSVDFGDRRIGIAVSDEDKKYSFARNHLINDDRVFSKLTEIVKEERVSRIIIGYPLNLKSERTVQTNKTEQFKNSLEKILQNSKLYPEIIFFDERLTSKIAEQSILDSGLRKKKRQDKGLIDSIAAQIILEDYINSIEIKKNKI